MSYSISIAGKTDGLHIKDGETQIEAVERFEADMERKCRDFVASLDGVTSATVSIGHFGDKPFHVWDLRSAASGPEQDWPRRAIRT